MYKRFRDIEGLFNSLVFIPSFGNKKFLCVGGNNEIAKTNLNFQSTLEIFATLLFNWSLFFHFYTQNFRVAKFQNLRYGKLQGNYASKFKNREKFKM